MDTISIRFDDVKELDSLSQLLKETRSELLRELVEKGRTLKAVELYKDKKASLGLAARIAGVPIGEFIDILAEYKIQFNIELEDAKTALEHAEKLL